MLQAFETFLCAALIIFKHFTVTKYVLSIAAKDHAQTLIYCFAKVYRFLHHYGNVWLNISFHRIRRNALISKKTGFLFILSITLNIVIVSHFIIDVVKQRSALFKFATGGGKAIEFDIF